MRWWGWVLIFIVIYWAIHHTTAAAGDVHGVGNFLSDVFGS